MSKTLPRSAAERELYERYAFRITDQIERSIISKNDPVARQYIPSLKELDTTPEENPDPIGDEVHSPVRGIVHRHADRVLFKITSTCAVYCRFCFRREMVGPGQQELSAKDVENALDYIRAHSEIFEVILTGGDPLILSPRRLKAVMDKLNDIDHVKIIRIHTRIPIADPARITGELCDSLKSGKPLYMALHINHAQEITQEARAALAKLHEAGITMLSQSVLLRGVNDNAQSLEDLYKELLALHVKPYYLHHPDLAPGTSHFRLPIAEGQEILRALQGRMTGLAMPHYMLDIPGGFGKINIMSDAVQPLDNGEYLIRDSKGRKHHYPSKQNI